VLARVLTRAEAAAAEVEERVRQAYERGRLEGERALSEQLVQQRQETSQLVEGVVCSLRGAVMEVVRETEQELVGLALEVARKIVCDMPVSMDVVEASVQEALGQVESGAEVQVYLHAEDLGLLQAGGSGLMQEGEGGVQLSFHTSAEVTRGGCVVRTRFGTIDGLRETKFDQLRKELTA
jgi:flagellar assembly protein FliH